MTLEKLDYVLALAEERNMRKASARLYISQPGLTAYINKLERHLGVKLFDRTVSPIQITEAGTLYISKMKEIQKTEAILRAQLQDMGTKRRTLRIGMGMTRGMQWLPILLPSFQKVHPDVSIRIQEGSLQDLESGIANNTLDVAFGAMTPGFADITYENLREELIYCVIPRSAPGFSHLKSHEATLYHPGYLKPEQLKSLTILMPSPSNGYFQFTQNALMNLFQQKELQIQDTMVISNLDTAYKLAAAGCGALIINAYDYHRAHPELDPKLAFYMLGEKPIYRISKIAYKADSPNRDLIDTLRDIIQTELLPMLNEGYPQI